jgi:hypothetical protein
VCQPTMLDQDVRASILQVVRRDLAYQGLSETAPHAVQLPCRPGNESD